MAGVSIDTLLAQVEHEATYVLAFCDGGYTTNLPLADVTGGQAWLAFGYDGSRWQPEHGGPARLLVPHLYFWKSAKWVRGLELLITTSPGSGRPTATTCTGIHGGNSGTRATDLAGCHSRHDQSGNGVDRHVTLDLPGWAGHLAGQHLDVRLTAEDGYVAERSYSIASAPGEQVAITVEDCQTARYRRTWSRRPGRVTSRVARADRRLLRLGRRCQALAAGGRRVGGRAAAVDPAAPGPDRRRTPARLLYSARSLDDVVYRAELDSYGGGAEVIYTLTRRQPPGWTGHSGRVDDAMLAQVSWPAGQHPEAYVCGPTNFVESVASGLVRLGYPAQTGPDRAVRRDGGA